MIRRYRIYPLAQVGYHRAPAQQPAESGVDLLRWRTDRLYLPILLKARSCWVADEMTANRKKHIVQQSWMDISGHGFIRSTLHTAGITLSYKRLPYYAPVPGKWHAKKPASYNIRRHSGSSIGVVWYVSTDMHSNHFCTPPRSVRIYSLFRLYYTVVHCIQIV